MFAQPDLGLANGPILVTHQTENRQQLGLVEQSLAETTSAIAPPASIENNNSKPSDMPNFLCRSEDVNRAT